MKNKHAINYVIAKEAVLIPGIKNKKQANEILSCVIWGLTAEEVSILKEVAILDESVENSGRQMKINLEMKL